MSVSPFVMFSDLLSLNYFFWGQKKKNKSRDILQHVAWNEPSDLLLHLNSYTMSNISSCDAGLTFRTIITASDTFSILCVGMLTDGSLPAEYFQITQCGNVFQSHCTLSGGSHCFQPVHLPCTDQVAAQGDDRWCLLPSTEQSHTPSCLRTPCCHCLGLLGWNPGWWELCVLQRKTKKKCQPFSMKELCQSSAKIISTCQLFFFHRLSCRWAGILVLCRCVYTVYHNYNYNYVNWHIFSSEVP